MLFPLSLSYLATSSNVLPSLLILWTHKNPLDDSKSISLYHSNTDKARGKEELTSMIFSKADFLIVTLFLSKRLILARYIKRSVTSLFYKNTNNVGCICLWI